MSLEYCIITLTSDPLRMLLIGSESEKHPEQVRVQVREGDATGSLKFEGKADLSRAGSRRTLLKDMAGLEITASEQDVMGWYEQYMTWFAMRLTPSPPKPEGFVITVRLKDSSRIVTNEDPAAALREALENEPNPEDASLEWEGQDRLAALYLNYPDERPSEELLEALAEAIRPTPLCWWTTSKGLNLVYAAVAPYTADELAACGVCAAITADPTLKSGLRHSVRHPNNDRNNR